MRYSKAGNRRGTRRGTIETYAKTLGVEERVARAAGGHWEKFREIPVYTMRNRSRAGYFRFFRAGYQIDGAGLPEPYGQELYLHEKLAGEDLKAVFLHECAHGIVAYESKHANHNYLWQGVARALGVSHIADERCYHGPDLNAERPTKFQYFCRDCGAICQKVRRPKWDVEGEAQVRQGIYHTPCKRKAHAGALSRVAGPCCPMKLAA